MARSKIFGTKLWKVRVTGMDSSYLWITGPFKTVATKALRVARTEYGVQKPTIDSIEAKGTLDA